MNTLTGSANRTATVKDGIAPVLHLAGLGLKVFPLPPGSKKANLPDWPNRGVNDPDTIRQHWPRHANIAVPMRANGLLGIDLDAHDPTSNGRDTFTRLCEQYNQPWPHTLTVETPNGLHLYTWAPPDRPLGNSSGKLGPGIDTRGPGAGSSGGYLVGPGSVVAGKPYRIVCDAPIIPLPPWLVDLLDPPRGPVRPVTYNPRTADRYALAALTKEVQAILDTPPGNGTPGVGRNEQLNRSAFSLGTLVGAGLLEEAAVYEALRAAADAVGLTAEDGERQVQRTIRSGVTSGARRPRTVRGSR